MDQEAVHGPEEALVDEHVEEEEGVWQLHVVEDEDEDEDEENQYLTVQG